MTGTLRIISSREVSDLGPMSYESSPAVPETLKISKGRLYVAWQ